jgi:hypothetical protein
MRIDRLVAWFMVPTVAGCRIGECVETATRRNYYGEVESYCVRREGGTTPPSRGPSRYQRRLDRERDEFPVGPEETAACEKGGSPDAVLADGVSLEITPSGARIDPWTPGSSHWSAVVERLGCPPITGAFRIKGDLTLAYGRSELVFHFEDDVLTSIRASRLVRGPDGAELIGATPEAVMASLGPGTVNTRGVLDYPSAGIHLQFSAGKLQWMQIFTPARLAEVCPAGDCTWRVK